MLQRVARAHTALFLSRATQTERTIFQSMARHAAHSFRVNETANKTKTKWKYNCSGEAAFMSRNGRRCSCTASALTAWTIHSGDTRSRTHARWSCCGQAKTMLSSRGYCDYHRILFNMQARPWRVAMIQRRGPLGPLQRHVSTRSDIFERRPCVGPKKETRKQTSKQRRRRLASCSACCRARTQRTVRYLITKRSSSQQGTATQPFLL